MLKSRNIPDTLTKAKEDIYTENNINQIYLQTIKTGRN